MSGVKGFATFDNTAMLSPRDTAKKQTNEQDGKREYKTGLHRSVRHPRDTPLWKRLTAFLRHPLVYIPIRGSCDGNFISTASL